MRISRLWSRRNFVPQLVAEPMSRMPSYVLLCGSGLCGTIPRRFHCDAALRIRSVNQVRMTFGCRFLSIP